MMAMDAGAGLVANLLGTCSASRQDQPLLDISERRKCKPGSMRRSIARCSRAVEAGSLSTVSIAIWKYPVASRNADLANAFLAAYCRSVGLHPVQRVDA